MKQLKDYKINLLNENYFLSSDEDEQLLLETFNLVDYTMKKIFETSNLKDQKKIAILTALKIALDKVKIDLKFKEESNKYDKLLCMLNI